jgi:hypothetical protein
MMHGSKTLTLGLVGALLLAMACNATPSGHVSVAGSASTSNTLVDAAPQPEVTVIPEDAPVSSGSAPDTATPAVPASQGAVTQSLLPSDVPLGAPAPRKQLSEVDVAERARPWLVHISLASATGSGVVASTDGRIVTNPARRAVRRTYSRYAR